MYLKIENNGVCDSEAFTLLGVSTTRYSSNSETIGMFGSGMKQAICLFLRNHINPIIFIGNLRLEFFSKLKFVKGVAGEGRSYNQVCCRITGKDQENKQINRTEECGFVTELGEMDWTEIGMGLREIISNAIDASYKISGDMTGVTIEPVADNQVRAKAGHTRCFLPLNPEISEYYKKLPEYFLHFTRGKEVYEDSILPRKGVRKQAAIFRRGVQVGTISRTPASLFDYNLRDIALDESRNIKSWVAQNEAGKALRDAPVGVICEFLQATQEENCNELWEMTFDRWSIDPSSLNGDNHATTINRWKQAWEQVFGAQAVAIPAETFLAELARRKGLTPVVIKNLNTLEILHNMEIPRAASIFGKEELLGHQYKDATPAVIKCLDDVWNKLQEKNLTENKLKPSAQCFIKGMNAEGQCLGFYLMGGDKVYINVDIAENDTFILRKVMLEELAHYITGSYDSSRDFQDFAFRVATAFMG